MTIAVLLASVQCLSACTLASCAPAPQDSQLPPCHQHHQQSPPHNNCDHQKAVNAPSADLAVAHLALAPVAEFLPVLLPATPLELAAYLAIESPPLQTSSVLRI